MPPLHLVPHAYPEPPSGFLLRAASPPGRRYAMKTLEKAEMLERNKVMRVLTEARILAAVDHPFLASLYGTVATDTHLHFLMQLCEGGELYALLTSQPSKRFKESHVRFYTSEVGHLWGSPSAQTPPCEPAGSLRTHSCALCCACTGHTHVA